MKKPMQRAPKIVNRQHKLWPVWKSRNMSMAATSRINYSSNCKVEQKEPPSAWLLVVLQMATVHANLWKGFAVFFVFLNCSSWVWRETITRKTSLEVVCLVSLLLFIFFAQMGKNAIAKQLNVVIRLKTSVVFALKLKMSVQH